MTNKVNVEKLISKNLSKSKIHSYIPQTSVDGEGYRVAVFVSGCVFACKGCYNKKTQNFNAGFDYSKEFREQIISDLSPSYIQGLSLIGGEPFLNTGVGLDILRRVREVYGDTKDIWCWTGYSWEELHESIACDTLNSKKQGEMLSYIDVLVDGRFVQDLFKRGLHFRGSTNQRIIDVNKSTEDDVVLWNNGDYI